MAKRSVNQLMASTKPVMLTYDEAMMESRIRAIENKMEFINERVEVVKKLIESNNKLLKELMDAAKNNQAILPVPLMVENAS